MQIVINVNEDATCKSVYELLEDLEKLLEKHNKKEVTVQGVVVTAR